MLKENDSTRLDHGHAFHYGRREKPQGPRQTTSHKERLYPVRSWKMHIIRINFQSKIGYHFSTPSTVHWKNGH